MGKPLQDDISRLWLVVDEAKNLGEEMNGALRASVCAVMFESRNLAVDSESFREPEHRLR